MPAKLIRLRDADAERNRLWDAARAEFCRHGLQQASIAAIARQAGVSRPTLYRHCGTKDQIISAVILREVVEALGRLKGATQELATAEERTAEALVLGMRETRTNDLVRALRAHDPDLLIKGVLRHEDNHMKLLRSTIAGILNDASIDKTAAEQAVEIIIRLVGTLLMAPSPVLPLSTDEQARLFAEKYFIPIVAAARQEPLS